MVGKRGLSGTATTIIIVLVVLVATILVFNFIGKEETVAPDPIAAQCASACASGQKVSFCDVDRSFGAGMATCNELATSSQYGVQTCSAISCSTQQETPQDNTCVAGLNSEWGTPTSDGNCLVKNGFYSRKRTPSDSPPTAGQICCYYYQ